MKCYRCGEENPDPPTTLEQRTYNDALQSIGGMVRHYKCMQCDTETTITRAPTPVLEELARVKEELEEAHEELAGTHAWVEELRAELRRYEPSDAVMYKLLGMQQQLDDAETICSRLLEGVDVTEEASTWLKRHLLASPQGFSTPEPEKTILALHTVIDEARRLFDRAWDKDILWTDEGERDESTCQIWASIDEWRQRVLVKEARETVSGQMTGGARRAR